jgi:hypothetical protein
MRKGSQDREIAEMIWENNRRLFGGEIGRYREWEIGDWETGELREWELETALLVVRASVIIQTYGFCISYPFKPDLHEPLGNLCNLGGKKNDHPESIASTPLIYPLIYSGFRVLFNHFFASLGKTSATFVVRR